jgi:hypothetical protein
VPGQDDGRSADFDALGLPSHEGQKLGDVRTQGVIGEVVLHGPDRIQPQRLRHQRDVELVLVHVEIALRQIGVILKQHQLADFHGRAPRGKPGTDENSFVERMVARRAPDSPVQSCACLIWRK